MSTKPPTWDEQPLANVEWCPREAIKPNNYNPNKMAPPERRLLKVSLLEDGWTQPIVLFQDEKEEYWIVDGFHRWELSGDPEVAEMTGGLVPVVKIHGSLEHRMMSTIRHNRARGKHAVTAMADIVRTLLERGCSQEAIQELLQMEHEEVERLSERAGLPEVVSRSHKEFNAGWTPG